MNIGGPKLPDYLLLTGLAIVFGASFMFTSIALKDFSPLTVAASRIGLAALLVYVFMKARNLSLPPPGRLWFYIVGSALFGNALPFALVSWGQVGVEAGLAAILMAIMPLFAVVIAHFSTADEKLNRYKLFGVILGLIGVVVLMGWNELGQLGDKMMRQYAIALAAVSYALNAILTKRLANTARLPMITALLLAGTAMILPFALILEQPWQTSPGVSSLLSVFVLALGPTALATWVILVIIDRQGASFLSQINFLVPVFGVLLARVFLGEKLPANAWIALGIILCAIAVARRGSR